MAKVTMLLAQGPGKPDGDVQQGLELRACLTKNGHIDVAAYEADPSRGGRGDSGRITRIGSGT